MSAVAIPLVFVACSAAQRGADGDSDADDQSLHESALTAVYTDGTGSYRYVDTHDHYDNTGVVDPSRFLYFHKVGGKRAVGLTMDCAWVEPDNANEILDVLKRHDLHITFFISGPFIFESPRQGIAGGFVEKNLPVIKRMIDEGHEFGSHTQNHPHNDQSIDWTRENSVLLDGWNAVVAKIYAGQETPANATMKNYWRAPYGEYDARALGLGAKAGFPFHFGWNVDVKDAVGYPSCADAPNDRTCLDPQKLTDTVLAFGDKNHWNLDGFVILSHLQNPYHWGKDPEGLERLLETVEQKGLVISRISEMFIESTAAPDGAPAPATPEPGATCGEGCIFSGMCADKAPHAKHFPSDDGDLVCVKSGGDCSQTCPSP